MLKINWKVRFKNPVWWAQLLLAIFLPILAYFGMQWEDMTTWGAILEVLSDAVKNPVVVVAVIISVWNNIVDPTTRGLGDSEDARGYSLPK